MGFAPHKGSKKAILEKGDLPTKQLKAFGSTSNHAKVWPYLIMALLTASVSVLYYFVIFPAMETSGLHDGITFAVSAAYFGIMAILFYYVFEPALINAFSKSGRFITKEESSSMALFMNATFIIVSFSGYFAFIRSVLNKKAENQTKPRVSEDDQTSQVINLLKAANQIQ